MSDQETDRVVAEHYESVLRVAVRETGNRADAEEITQDVFMAYVAGRIREPGGLYVAVRRAAWKLRTRRRRQSSADDVGRLLSSGPLPGTAAELSELVQSVRKEIVRLSEASRDLVLRRYYAGQSISAIAESTNTTKEAIRKRLYDIRQSLRPRLEAFAPSS